MIKFEQYLEQFDNTVSAFDFVVALLLTALLAMMIRLYYIRFGDAVSNRRRFANTFLPLALSTMLIITIVKSSIALSLGLVGALSIVRFRAAIKDPEELTYLFLVIGMGLAVGANQFVVALIAVPSILLLLWLHKVVGTKQQTHNEGRMFANIDTDVQDMEKINLALTQHFSFVELNRLDNTAEGLSLSYTVKADDIQSLDVARNQIVAMSANTRIAFVKQPDLVL